MLLVESSRDNPLTSIFFFFPSPLSFIRNVYKETVHSVRIVKMDCACLCKFRFWTASEEEEFKYGFVLLYKNYNADFTLDGLHVICIL